MSPKIINEASLDEFAERTLESKIVDAIDQVELTRDDVTQGEISVDQFSENALHPAVNNAVNKVEIHPGKFQFLLNYRGLQVGLLLEGIAFLLIVCTLFGLIFGVEPLLQLLALLRGR